MQRHSLVLSLLITVIFHKWPNHKLLPHVRERLIKCPEVSLFFLLVSEHLGSVNMFINALILLSLFFFFSFFAKELAFHESRRAIERKRNTKCEEARGHM
jgi:uncharacterized membrane protein